MRLYCERVKRFIISGGADVQGFRSAFHTFGDTRPVNATMRKSGVIPRKLRDDATPNFRQDQAFGADRVFREALE
jgi:hypothetical protein